MHRSAPRHGISAAAPGSLLVSPRLVRSRRDPELRGEEDGASSAARLQDFSQAARLHRTYLPDLVLAAQYRRIPPYCAERR